MNENQGHLHPLTTAIRDIHAIFQRMGFEIANGPELETEFYNFDALNIPKDHPARDMQDTFWIKTDKKDQKDQKDEHDRSIRPVLRTHTSPVQIRYMESHMPPYRVIVPGKVFRNEATDATHEAQFYQIEGLVIDKKISMAHLKGTLEKFYTEFFGDNVQVRFRPSFFPFVEPALEVDIFYRGKWLEVKGAGLVHPNVLKAAGIDPATWQGFAFGGGIERLAMIKYGIDDVRQFYSGDLRFVNQF
ncbi:phenylalanine--tRNA ligase subunit alpha [Patescibacteria group bacterium]|nr:phenylalanine--tRNA ligase subunit alpha [Patescibacteria group bacterium]